MLSFANIRGWFRIGIAVWILAAASPQSHAEQPDVHPAVALINQAIEQGWEDYEVTPAPQVSDSVWCRRVFLDVVGRVPTLAEQAEFADDRGRQKREKLVERLLYDDRYTEDYTNHWSTVWSNLLIGRSGGNDRRSLTNRDGMQQYLRDSFANNKTYDRLAYELITATGSSKPGTDRFNGAVNFLIDKVNEDKATLATSSTSRIFIGQQVQCTQCHNHPFNQWKQKRFWEFNSFFRQTRALRRFAEGTRNIESAELIDQDFGGEANDAEDALIFYELRNGLTKVAYPVFSDGDKAYPISQSGYVEDVVRRKELAKLMLQTEDFDRMIVNRMWSLFLGHGFTKPIDDLGPHNPASHPELLNQLAAMFRQNSYDLKKLITWITASRPYQLDSVLSSGNTSDDPSIGESPKFSRFYLRQMSAEQLYQSILSATDSANASNYQQQEALRRRWLRQFVVAFGTDEGDEATTFNGSIPQALMLFNGELTRNATATDQDSFLSRLSASSRSPKEAVSKLFMAGLSRRPTRKEITMSSQLLRARGSQAEMLQDLWWAILNSNEFIFQH